MRNELMMVAEPGHRKTVDPRPILSKPSAAEKYLREYFADSAVEECYALTLDAKMRAIGTYLVSRGTAICSLIEPREIFRKAVLDCACKVIVAHNHPSGDPLPSAEDIRITRRLFMAGEILGIELVDHLIIGTSPQAISNGYSSLAELGYIDNGKN
ncbi:MAG: JAB domain-containing protein [Victivallales bacterium]|nr:JAB domain-containing protein [Victivallales bacterium]